MHTVVAVCCCYFEVDIVLVAAFPSLIFIRLLWFHVALSILLIFRRANPGECAYNLKFNRQSLLHLVLERKEQKIGNENCKQMSHKMNQHSPSAN